MRLPLLLAALAAAQAMPVRASQAFEVSVETLAREYDLVVRGRVGAVRSSWSEAGGRIFTVAEVAPSAAWRGRPPATLRVLVPGGVVGRIGQRVDGAPTFVRGEDVVLFLAPAEAGFHRVSGLAQGKFTVVGDEARPDRSGIQFVGNRVGPGQRAAGPMPVAELERRVRSIR
jgi:hypothetical protein